MNKQPFKAIVLAALFGGALTITSCDTGQKPGDVNTEDSDVERPEAKSSEYDVNSDTTDMAEPYEDDKGAVHAGDGKSDGVDREDVDKKP